MIAPRAKKPSALPPAQDPQLRARLLELAGSGTATAYGVWHGYATDTAALRAIVDVISTVVLARRLRFEMRPTGQALEFTISNRHLIDVTGIAALPEEPDSQQILAALRAAITGADSLKFTVAEDKPTLGTGTRSWPHDALLQAIEDMSEAAGAETHWCDALRQGLKTHALAWAEYLAEQAPVLHGDEACQHRLHQLAQSRAPFGPEPLGTARPSLVMLDADDQRLFVALNWGDGQLFALLPSAHRAELLALWRRHLPPA